MSKKFYKPLWQRIVEELAKAPAGLTQQELADALVKSFQVLRPFCVELFNAKEICFDVKSKRFSAADAKKWELECEMQRQHSELNNEESLTDLEKLFGITKSN
jgi:hypothetical protein